MQRNIREIMYPQSTLPEIAGNENKKIKTLNTLLDRDTVK